MRFTILSFLLILFYVHPQSSLIQSSFVVWNVGQGLWTTWRDSTFCYHFDMGGEKNPIKEVLKYCLGRKHQIYISHLDYDHIRFVPQFIQRQPTTCINYPHPWPHRWRTFTPCQTKPDFILSLFQGRPSKNRNSLSQVYLVHQQILLPGDSTFREEKIWLQKMPRKIKLVVLGHHGSKTSTSKHFFKYVHPKWTVVSARKKKYGHPHPSVLQRTLKNKIPCLETEDWGHIHFEMNTL